TPARSCRRTRHRSAAVRAAPRPIPRRRVGGTRERPMVGTRVRAQRARRIVIEIDDSTWRQLELVESCDADGILRIAMVGELDLAVAVQLSSRLDQLMRDGTPARLDLS